MNQPKRWIGRLGVCGLAIVMSACAGGGESSSSDDPRGGRWVNGQWVAARYEEPVRRSRLREQALDRLLEATRDRDPQMRWNALEALSVTPRRLEPLVLEALRDPNAGVRTVAATLVGREKLSGLTDQVWPLLQDASPYVRASAIYALRSNGAQPDPTPIGAMLTSHPSPRVRAHAAFLIGEMGNTSALSMLRQAAATTDAPGSQSERRLLELQIAEAMVKLGDEGQIQTLRSALYPSRPEELEATLLALQALGEVGDRRQVDELLAVARYRDETGAPMPAEVRLTAGQSLLKLGERGAVQLADEHRFDAAGRIRALAAIAYGASANLETLPKLEAMLGDPEPVVQIAAAAGILRISDRVQSR
ncbi:MAG: HEAT repeat domain-containing protein [Planctomycetota bacterium]